MPRNWKNATSYIAVTHSFRIAGKIGFWMIAGECLEIVDEMGLVVISAFISDFREGFLFITIFIEGGMKPDNPAEKLRGETRECEEFPLELTG